MWWSYGKISQMKKNGKVIEDIIKEEEDVSDHHVKDANMYNMKTLK